MKTFRVSLIRHAMTDANRKGVYCGHSDNPICEEGEKELESLKENFVYPLAEVVLTSPLKRAVDSARIIYPEINPVVINEMTEYNFGEFEGMSAEQLKYNDKFSKWLAGDKNVRPEGGESEEDFSLRISKTFENIVNGVIKSGVREVSIITHGGIIMTILAIYGLPECSREKWISDFGHGFSLLITPSVWRTFKKVEIVGQIPMEKAED